MRVLIVRLGSMGDVLHALPAVAALRATHPDAHIGWAVERRWTPLLVSGRPTLTDFGRVGNQEPGWPTLAGVARVGNTRSPQRPLVDRVHIVDTLGWRRAPVSDATWSDIRDTFRDLRAERYDIAIDFQGSIKSALVAQLSGATSRIGFAQPREKPATMFYTSQIRTKGRHVIEQNLDLIEHLGVAYEALECPLPFDDSANGLIDQKLKDVPAERFAILNPGAGWGGKQWPASRYAQVARDLGHYGMFSLVNFGPTEESLAREVELHSDGAARAVSCTLGELIELTRRASLFIGGDTGPMHLATCLGIPVVALFGPTDPARNGPFTLPSIVLRHPSSRTSLSHTLEADPGLVQITAAEVIAAARDLLARVPHPDRRWKGGHA